MNNFRRRQVTALLTLCAIAALTIADAAHADASAGRYLGYQLGDRFTVPDDLVSERHVAGPVVYSFEVNSRDHGVDTMSLYVSPKSSIIGSIFGEWYFASKRSAERFADRYLDTLRRRYEQWTPKGDTLTNDDYQLTVEVQKKPKSDEFWPSPHKYRVAASLIYAPDSLGRGEWMAIVYLENSNLELAAGQTSAEIGSP